MGPVLAYYFNRGEPEEERSTAEELRAEARNRPVDQAEAVRPRRLVRWIATPSSVDVLPALWFVVALGSTLSKVQADPDRSGPP